MKAHISPLLRYLLEEKVTIEAIRKVMSNTTESETIEVNDKTYKITRIK